MVEEIKTDIDEETNKPFWKKMLAAFAVGVMRGLGIVIGTTVVVGILVYLMQVFIDWTDIQIGLTSWLSDILDQGIAEAIPAGISSLIK